MSRKKLSLAAGGLAALMTAMHNGYKNHWWWDNVAHVLSGFAVSMYLPDDREKPRLFAICVVWELFEWSLARAKLYERFEWFPEGPRSMGYEGWTFDHQVEDTILDTVMAFYGLRAARWVKDKL